MHPDRWRQVQDLFQRAVALPVEDRAPFLATECGEDTDLLAEVDSLLANVIDRDDPFDNSVRSAARSVLGQSETDDCEAPPGELGPYRIVGKLGEGGMSRVYLAERQGEFQQQVAIKILKAGVHADLLRRFRNERQILASLNHPRIARILDGGSTPEGLPYLVMERIEGIAIDAYCAEQQLGLRERLTLMGKICDAVQFAHENLVVHRDLKPANILVTADGEPKLLDFGIAKLLEPDPALHDTEVTQQGLRLLSFSYASPEQVKALPITPASDVYSLGVILYELLVGRRPYEFVDEPPYERERIVCEVDPPRPSVAANRTATARALTGDLDWILLRSLAKDPTQRYRTVMEFGADLRAYLASEPVSAVAPTRGYRMRKFLRRNRVPVATGAVFVVLLVVALTTITGFYFESQRLRVDEQVATQTARQRLATMRSLLGDVLSEFHDVIRDLPGAVESRRVFATKARTYLDELIGDASPGGDATEDPTLLRELAVAYVKVGDVQGHPANANLGETEEALRSYRKALELFRRDAVDALPTDDGFDAAVILDRIGEVTMSRDVDAALQLYEDARRVRERLYGGAPSSRAYREGMARSDSRVGSALLFRGKPEAARQHFERAVPVLQGLAGSLDDAELQRSAAAAMLGLAAARVEMGATEAGLQANLEAVQLFEELRRRDPLNMRFQRELSIAYSRVVRCLTHLGRPRDALRYARDARALSEAIAAADPKNVDAQRELCLSDLQLGHLHAQVDDTATALQCYQAGLARNEVVRSISHDDRRLTRDRWLLLFRVAQLHEKNTDLVSAVDAYDAAARVCGELVRSDDANLRYRRFLATSLLYHGKSLARLDRHAEALAQLTAAREHYATLAERQAEGTSARHDLATADEAWAATAARAGDAAQAIVAYARAGDLWCGIESWHSAEAAYGAAHELCGVTEVLASEAALCCTHLAAKIAQCRSQGDVVGDADE